MAVTEPPGNPSEPDYFIVENARGWNYRGDAEWGPTLAGTVWGTFDEMQAVLADARRHDPSARLTWSWADGRMNPDRRAGRVDRAA